MQTMNAKDFNQQSTSIESHLKLQWVYSNTSIVIIRTSAVLKRELKTFFSVALTKFRLPNFSLLIGCYAAGPRLSLIFRVNMVLNRTSVQRK